MGDVRRGRSGVVKRSECKDRVEGTHVKKGRRDSTQKSRGVGGTAETEARNGHRGHLPEQVHLMSHLSAHVWNSQEISFFSKLPR